MPRLRRRMVSLGRDWGSHVLSDEFMVQARWELVLLSRRALAGVSPRQRRLISEISRNGHDLRVNLGSGPRPKPGWVNLDVAFKPDLVQHLGHPLDLPDECARLVFSDHVLMELVYPRQARMLLSEAWRILQPGGHFRLVIPDFEKIMRAYVEEDFRPTLAELVPEADSPIAAVNMMFRHNTFGKYAWDFDLVQRELQRAGFNEVRRASFRDSAVPELNVDLDEDPARIAVSLYVEARK